MPMTVRASSPDLKVLAKALKQAGDKDLRRELYRGMARAVKPVRAAVKAAWTDKMPSENGLNLFVADAPVAVKQRGANVRITARGTKRRIDDQQELERGILRHPVHGNRNVWVKQAVPPNVFSDACRETVDDTVVSELLAAIEVVARKIVTA